MKKPPLPLALVGLSMFLAPWIGGQITLEAQQLQAGWQPFLSGVWAGSELPGFAHALIAGLAFAALAVTFWREKAIQTPTIKVGIPIAALIVCLGGSILLSSFKFISVQVWLEWTAYGAAFFAVVSSCGRGTGPKMVLAAIVLGSTLTAIRGLLEYGQMRGIDPSWRIFAGYNNPNALATMMLIGLFCAMGLILNTDRVGKLVSLLCAAVIGFALMLTQSKGGYLAACIGTLSFAALVFFWGGWRRALIGLLPIAAVGGLALTLQYSLRSNASGSGALSRVTAASSTSEQSAGFRKMLWTSAIKQIAQTPQGLGVGTYAFHSSRTGLVQQTHLTHNTYLQLAVEASPVAALCLVAGLLIWLVETLRGARKMPVERNVLRAGVISAVLAVSAHGMIESNLYYFGVGFVFFGLLAVGLQLAADGSGPELVPIGIRRGTALICFTLPCLGLIYFGVVEYKKAALRGLAASGSVTGPMVDALTEIAPADGESWYLRANLTPDATPEDRIAWLKKAAELTPRTRYFRALAQVYWKQGKVSSAKSMIDSVLKEDPNNLRALDMLMEIQKSENDLSGAQATARRMIAIEQTPYLQITAIPEFVETESLFARELVADQSKDTSEQARLLNEAVEGLVKYAKTTVPAIRQNTGGDPNGSYLGESLRDAEEKLTHAQALAGRLLKLYRSLGNGTGVETVTEASGVFEEALAGLAGGNK